MEAIRAWTLSVCMACVAAGILLRFVSTRQHASVIKLVLTIYILVTALAPFQAMRYPETRAPSVEVTAAAQPVDTDTLILEVTQKNLSEAVEAACAAGGYPVRKAEVHLTVEAGAAQIMGVTLFVQEGTNTQEVSRLAADVLETQVPVTIQKEE